MLLILLDAFGLEFLDAHAGHPLLERLDVRPLRSQFPSTTTAHVTTAHFAVPVEDHGLYEWNILEPSLNRIICPLRFTPAESSVPAMLAGALEPSALAPGPTLYESLTAPAVVLQPQELADTIYTHLSTRGASVRPFELLPEGVHAAVRALSGSTAARYGFLYWDEIDRAGHVHGPSSPEFHAAARAALDALWSSLRDVDREIAVLITADHGQVDVSPDRVDYLDELWPELVDLLSIGRPAGSSRDAFLHVREGQVETVIEGLSERLGNRAEVRRAADLFDQIGPRLRERLGDVAVLAAPGRQVWLRSAAANERWFRGQHGGLEPAETATYVAELVK